MKAMEVETDMKISLEELKKKGFKESGTFGNLLRLKNGAKELLFDLKEQTVFLVCGI